MKDSYSQYGEDLIALEIYKKHGGDMRMLEIGAWHPTDKSNSRLFIEKEWDAILVEPSPAGVAALTKEYVNHPDVIVFACPVTVHGGFITLNLTDDALSCEQIPEQWVENGGHYGAARFYSVSVAELINHIGGDFDIVSIDTEGTSVDVFYALMDTGCRPRVVIVEYDDPARLVELANKYQFCGYRQAHLNGTNIILEWLG